MPRPRVNGTLQPIRQKIRVTYSPAGGQQIEIPYESAGRNLAGAALAFEAQRVAYDWEISGAKSRIVARCSGPQAGLPDKTTDEWQILANEIQKDVTENPQFQNVSSDDIRKIKKALNSDSESSPALTDADAIELYDCLLRGHSHYSVSQYVIKHTTNVANNYAANVSDFNVERLYSFGQLIGAGGELVRRDLWVFPMPGRLIAKLQDIAAPPIHANYFWSWRKLASTETTAAGDRIAISTEYWLEQWRRSLYPLSAYGT